MRDKSRALCELLSDNEKLQQEREFARQTREKFAGGVTANASNGQQTMGSAIPAGPASGKYGGFGSKDMD